MIVLPLAFERWNSVEHSSDAAQRLYVADELRRLEREGAPLLTVALAQLDEKVRHLACTLLRMNDDGEGKQIFPSRSWMLRLVDGETPPDADAQGRKLPPEKRGKVLKAKVANLGGQLGGQADQREVSRWSGMQRQARERQGGDLYVYREVTREPQAFTFDEALAILAQWGIGVQTRKYRRPSSWAPGRENDESVRGQCNWLVEECSNRSASSGRGKAA
jgi:hypothetical protein